ncbi:HAD hydrolase, family IIIA (plasmid) [Piscirickettsia salmonis]|uniref:HAD hydrolase-like protein n=1 Tax=Piscirickettsia salmonis TaxID=1238 RepID=UPI0012D92711|nr:HAD hydrolase-like protein [Piscirickettsia salmonis]QGP57436.1 HAD hydrolase, family IIIA [Piscirickettsia salmonis]
MLKGVIFGVDGVIVPNNRSFDKNDKLFEEIKKLLTFLIGKGIKVSILTNRPFEYVKKSLESKFPDIKYYSKSIDQNFYDKASKQASEAIISEMELNKNEVVYIGASKQDMRSAVNGNLLFLNVMWWGKGTDYGFDFGQPKDVAKFIDIFCLREHLWSYSINDKGLETYALAPYSTMKDEYKKYSHDARNTAKHQSGTPYFWASAIISSLYFSGLYERINIVTIYPGHQKGSRSKILDEELLAFSKCFRMSFIPELIVRHTTSQKSQRARNQNKSLNFSNQLNSIHLLKLPKKIGKDNDYYKNNPLRRKKGLKRVVLVIDDICTEGFSLESARTYLEQANTEVISVAWLKTINTNIKRLGGLSKFDPYKANQMDNTTVSQEYAYHDYFHHNLAPEELSNMFELYNVTWDWPQDLIAKAS